MVLAILAGFKLQTRRAIKFDNNELTADDLELTRMQDGFPEGVRPVFKVGDEPNAFSKKCPYGQVGDRLWVRETYGYNHAAAEASDVLVYRANYPSDQLVTWPRREKKRIYQRGGVKHEYTEEANHLYPSIFMPRYASRILLEITAVRVERVQDISEADAEAEGVGFDKVGDRKEYHNYLDETRFEPFAADSFKTLWQLINGPLSWVVNPWVWVVEFKVVSNES